MIKPWKDFEQKENLLLSFSFKLLVLLMQGSNFLIQSFQLMNVDLGKDLFQFQFIC